MKSLKGQGQGCFRDYYYSFLFLFFLRLHLYEIERHLTTSPCPIRPRSEMKSVLFSCFLSHVSSRQYDNRFLFCILFILTRPKTFLAAAGHVIRRGLTHTYCARYCQRYNSRSQMTQNEGHSCAASEMVGKGVFSMSTQW